MKKIFSNILLIFTIGVLLTSCVDASNTNNTLATTAATTVATTADRDTLTNPDLSEIEIEIITAMWEKYKSAALNNPITFYTINDISLEEFFEPCGDAYVLFVTDFMPRGDMLTKETVADCEFRYVSTQRLSVYCDGEFYSLQNAYTAGVVTGEEIRTVWEAYKAQNPTEYDPAEEDMWNSMKDQVKG